VGAALHRNGQKIEKIQDRREAKGRGSEINERKYEGVKNER